MKILITHVALLVFFIYFCIRFCSGCSAVRLAHLLWEQGVEGSNPFTPTLVDDVEQALFACSTFFFNSIDLYFHLGCAFLNRILIMSIKGKVTFVRHF